MDGQMDGRRWIGSRMKTVCSITQPPTYTHNQSMNTRPTIFETSILLPAPRSMRRKKKPASTYRPNGTTAHRTPMLHSTSPPPPPPKKKGPPLGHRPASPRYIAFHSRPAQGAHRILNAHHPSPIAQRSPRLHSTRFGGSHTMPRMLDPPS